MNYVITNGYFKEYKIYNSNEDNITYQLIYSYTVNENEYYISTDYGVNNIPERNSIRQIKYNLDNPKEAILFGGNKTQFLIYFGVFFVILSIPFIISIKNELKLTNSKKKNKKKNLYNLPLKKNYTKNR